MCVPWAGSVSATPAARRVAGGGLRGLGLRGVRRRGGGHRRLVGGLPAAPARAGRRGRVRLRLAERAHAPGRVDRLAARVAALLELAHAARAAQVVRLDLVVAVRAELI